MPKKRKHKSRRRVGAVALSKNNVLMTYGPIAAGFLLSDKINAQITKMVGDKIDAKIVGAGQIGVGALLTFGKKGGKGAMIKKILGGLLLGSGVKAELKALGIMSGVGPYGRVPVIAGRMNGAYGRVPVIAGNRRVNGGYTPNQQLGGYNPHGGLNGKMKVMGSVAEGRGSGLTSDSGSAFMN